MTAVPIERPGVPLGRRAGLAAYGLLGLPLAFAALPVYVHVPQLYGSVLGLPLATVGGVLLACRVVDAVTDPVIGWFSDRIADRRRLSLAGLPLLAAGLVLLLAPPAGAGTGWLVVSLLLATLGYSMSTINHTAWAAELGRDRQERSSAIAAREGFGLLGVVVAAALPGLIAADAATGLARLAWLFVPLVLVAAWVCARWAPRGRRVVRERASPLAAWRGALSLRPIRRLLVLLAVSGVAAAVPSATVMFFIADVLGAGHLAGGFLALYFLSGAAGLPLWLRLARRFGKAGAWMGAMVLAMGVFGWAATLGVGDVGQYALICALSGLALGADLALPPAILSDRLASGDPDARGGTWFGLWNLVTKASLALAAGLALPLLAWLGYRTGASDAQGLEALAWVYGALPLAFKAGALALLVCWRGDFAEEGA